MNVHFVWAALAVACDLGAGDFEPADVEQEQLAGRLAMFPLLDVGVPSAFGWQVTSGSDRAVAASSPEVAGGSVVLGMDLGAPVVEFMEVQLTDVEVELEKKGSVTTLQLTDLQLRLAEPAAVDAQWGSDQRHVSGYASGSLLLDWMLVGHDGEPIPLGTLTIPAVEVDLRAHLDPDNAIEVAIEASVPGEWRFGDIVVAELELAMTARLDPGG